MQYFALLSISHWENAIDCSANDMWYLTKEIFHPFSRKHTATRCYVKSSSLSELIKINEPNLDLLIKK